MLMKSLYNLKNACNKTMYHIKEIYCFKMFVEVENIALTRKSGKFFIADYYKKL